jgi:hypothetical protein
MGNRKILTALSAALAASCVEPSADGDPMTPDAGVVEKVACIQCETYCRNVVCYRKRYDNTLACTNEAYYSLCLLRCGSEVAALPELCIPQYLDLASCIHNTRSPAYVCSSTGQPVARDPWRCLAQSMALSSCKLTAPY